MPNIEIVGSLPNDLNEQIVRNIIMVHLSNEELKNVVFTIHKANVEDMYGCDAPYVRISDTNIERARRIAGLLNNIIDVEILHLAEFIPRKKKSGET